MKKLRKFFVAFLALVFAFSATATNLSFAQEAEQPPAVVINEISWTGTAANSSDEWIELYNTTSGDINLSGWQIDDDDGNEIYPVSTGIIAAHSYFLIEDSQEALSIPADLIANLSLSNSGDKLVLKDASGNAVDTVNGSGGMWYAGDNTSKSSMERINSSNANDTAANWANNTAASGALDRNGNLTNGTPRAANSVSVQRALVRLLPSETNPENGENIGIEMRVENAQNLFAYGFDIAYNPSVLEFINVANNGFLSENETAVTSLQAGLENNAEGKLVVAEARLSGDRTGVSGSGALFTMNFRVTGAQGDQTNVTIASNSFLSNPTNDLLADFSGSAISVAIIVTQPVSNLSARESASRYAISLSWQPSDQGADFYEIFRKDSSGNFTKLGSTTDLTFADSDNIIPNLDYEYRAVAVKNNRQSLPASIIQKDTRGLKGDNNRSDRIDGRDLERLARHFTETISDEEFETLIDTTFDARIDGSDLIDIAANWTLIYSGT